MAVARAFCVDRGGNKSFLREVFYYIFSSGLLACYFDDSKKGKPNCMSLHAMVMFTDTQIEGMFIHNPSQAPSCHQHKTLEPSKALHKFSSY
jgi:hypothetical protein